MRGDYGMIKTIKNYNLYDLANELSFLNRLFIRSAAIHTPWGLIETQKKKNGSKIFKLK